MKQCTHCDGTGIEKKIEPVENGIRYVQTCTVGGICCASIAIQHLSGKLSRIVAVSLGKTHKESSKEIRQLFPDAVLEDRYEFTSAITKVFCDTFVNDLLGPSIEFTSGTKFQQSVWREIMKIPYGKTKTYKDIAIALGKPKSVRAVANACGANITAIIVPCHRVIKSNGELGGYRWGEKIKKNLIEQESYDSFLLATQSYKQKWRA